MLRFGGRCGRIVSAALGATCRRCAGRGAAGPPSKRLVEQTLKQRGELSAERSPQRHCDARRARRPRARQRVLVHREDGGVVPARAADVAARCVHRKDGGRHVRAATRSRPAARAARAQPRAAHVRHDAGGDAASADAQMERKPFEACVTLGSKCRMARAAAAEGGGAAAGVAAAAAAAAAGTRRRQLTGCFLGDLEDKRRVHGGSEIGMWRNFKRDCGERDDAVAARRVHSPSSRPSSPPTSSNAASTSNATSAMRATPTGGRSAPRAAAASRSRACCAIRCSGCCWRRALATRR